MRACKLYPEFKAFLETLNGRGYTQAMIADRVGVHQTTISKFCKRHGIEWQRADIKQETQNEDIK